MIAELGHFALILALVVAVVQAILPIIGAARGDILWMRSGQSTAVAHALLVALAFAALMRSFIISDFSVVNVVENSHSLKPLLFKIAGTWGSHEGSLLLWVFILAIFAAGVAILAVHIPLDLKARILSVQAWISIGFLSFMLFTSNPFERLAIVNIPLDGNGLNPLLQDFSLAIHPPLLYFGYVGFSVVFSFAIAALIEGRIDPAWARWIRPWILVAWISLSAGIALGSWWAYYELGWGGWWFWDPVENVSFMPWLLGTALLHSAIVTEKRDTFKAWTILLAILTFSFSLFGTFIVRSGLLTSVHAFAVDPERGVFIFILLTLAIGGSLILFAFRVAVMEGGGIFATVSRETGLMVNNLLLTTAAMTVLFGTIYPLILEAVTGEKISVGPPFFNASFVPLSLPLLIIMGIVPFLSWKRADLATALLGLKWVLALTLLIILLVWYLQTRGPIIAVIVFGGGIWLLFTTLYEWGERIKLGRVSLGQSLRRAMQLPRSSYGMRFAHLGLALCVFGFVGSSAWKQDKLSFVDKGSQLKIAGFTVRFDGIHREIGANYTAFVGDVVVFRKDNFITRLHPERRHYPVAISRTTESAIYQTLVADLYVTINEPNNGAMQWTLRVIYDPLVNFIWLGVVFLVIGGLLSLSDRRLRIGAPRRTTNRRLTGGAL